MNTAATPKPRRKPKPKTPRPPLAVGTMLIGLDVSSKAAGIALMEKTATGPRLHRFALIVPTAGWDRFRRIDFIAAAVAKFAAESPADLAVIEFTTGVTWESKHRGTTYLVSLVSAQAVARAAIRHHVEAIELVSETEWTGRVKKEKRAEAIRRRYWRYQTVKDPGLDIADAIGIGDWRIQK